ncbi:hypothetical protein AB837_00042 [bacterium AB1]|nr:hypothetical protein AB837_00042 [bacterium AB1]
MAVPKKNRSLIKRRERRAGIFAKRIKEKNLINNICVCKKTNKIKLSHTKVV